MTDSTNERWLVNGTSLSQYCWAVKTFGGSPRALPTFRGSDISVAYIPGKIFRAKFPDSRVISLLMWVAGIDPSTSQPATDKTLQFSDNLRTLHSLIYTPSSQVQLTREWRYTVSGTPTIVSATANAQIAGDMQPTMTGQGRADFSADFLLTDPYFYGSTVTSSVPYSSNTTVTNPGDDTAAYNSFTITFNGPLFYPILTNTTNSASLTLNTMLNLGEHITVDIANYTALHSNGSDMRGVVQHSAARRWMSVSPGANAFTLSSSMNTDSGTVNISFQPPYV